MDPMGIYIYTYIRTHIEKGWKRTYVDPCDPLFVLWRLIFGAFSPRTGNRSVPKPSVLHTASTVSSDQGINSDTVVSNLGILISFQSLVNRSFEGFIILLMWSNFEPLTPGNTLRDLGMPNVSTSSGPIRDRDHVMLDLLDVRHSRHQGNEVWQWKSIHFHTGGKPWPDDL